MLTNVDLNRLRVFYYVFELNSIVKASEQLNITRSAVSQQLKKCEEEVGVTLFTRQHTSLVPTGDAIRLHRIVAPFLQELDTGLRELRIGGSEPSGMLRIGAPLEFGKTYLPGLIGRFRERYRRVTFSLTLGDPERLMRMVRSGELDFALIDLFLAETRTLSGDSPVFSILPLVEEEVVMICSREYYESRMKQQHDLKSLLKMDYITYQHNNLVLNTWFRHHYRKLAPALSIVLTVENVRAVVAAAQHHVGLGIVPYHVVRQEIEDNNVVVISSGRKQIINIISLLQLQDKVPSPAERCFLKQLRESVEDDLALFCIR